MTYQSKLSRREILSARTEISTLLKEEHCDTTSTEKIAGALSELAEDIEKGAAPDTFARAFIEVLKLPSSIMLVLMQDCTPIVSALRQLVDELKNCTELEERILRGLSETLNRLYVKFGERCYREYLQAN